MGIVMRTVGLEVGTGRGGITRALGGGAVWVGGGDTGDCAEGATGQAGPASSSAKGPDLSQAARTLNGIAMSRGVRTIAA